jgi:hypothetical protein
MLYFSVLLHCVDLIEELLCRLCATSFTILSNYPSSGVQVVVVTDSSSQCNVVFFPHILVTSGCFGYVGCTWLFLVCLVCWLWLP